MVNCNLSLTQYRSADGRQEQVCGLMAESRPQGSTQAARSSGFYLGLGGGRTHNVGSSPNIERVVFSVTDGRNPQDHT